MKIYIYTYIITYICIYYYIFTYIIYIHIYMKIEDIYNVSLIDNLRVLQQRHPTNVELIRKHLCL